MCGIIGYLSKAPRSELKHITTKMFISAQSRGTDATGIGYLNENNNVVVHKQAGCAGKYINTDVWKKLQMPKVFIGHTRSATRGEPSDNKNNHPLYSKSSRLAIAHNGVIGNYALVCKEHKLKPDGEVDSEVILKLIDKFLDNSKSLVDAVKKSMKEISGSATFSLIGDDYPDTLVLVKSSNPLWLAYVEELDTIFFASTKGILQAGLEKNILKFGFFEKRVPQYKVIYQEAGDDTCIVVTLQNGEYKVGFKEIETAPTYYYVGDSKPHTAKQKGFWNDEKNIKEYNGSTDGIYGLDPECYGD